MITSSVSFWNCLTELAGCGHNSWEISSGLRDKKVHVSPKLSGLKEQQFVISHNSTGLVWTYSVVTVSWWLCWPGRSRVASFTWVESQLGRLEWIARWLNLSLNVVVQITFLHLRAKAFQDGRSKNFGLLKFHKVLPLSLDQNKSWYGASPHRVRKETPPPNGRSWKQSVNYLKSTGTSRQDSLKFLK